MTVKDRILCALGFHGPMVESQALMDEKGLIANAVRCTVCGRDVWTHFRR